MKYDILHELPGRIRVHCQSLHLSADAKIELNRWVSEHAELLSASFSAKTGNLLILYAKHIDRQAILIILDKLSLFGDANIGEYIPKSLSLDHKIMDVIYRESTVGAIKAVLPRSLRLVHQGWDIGSGLLNLADTFLNGRGPAFLYAAGKFILFGLASVLPMARLLVAIGVIVFEHTAFEPFPDRAMVMDDSKARPTQPQLPHIAV